MNALRKAGEGPVLRCWLERTVNSPGTVEFSRQVLKGGAGVILGTWPYAA